MKRRPLGEQQTNPICSKLGGGGGKRAPLQATLGERAESATHLCKRQIGLRGASLACARAQGAPLLAPPQLSNMSAPPICMRARRVRWSKFSPNKIENCLLAKIYQLVGGPT